MLNDDQLPASPVYKLSSWRTYIWRIFVSLLKSFVKLTLKQMIAILILFYYNDVSMLLASFSS